MSDFKKIDYAILSAIPEEIEFISNKFAKSPYQEIKVNNLPFRIYEYQTHKILLACCGIGCVFAASVFTLIKTYFQPDYFLISGTAGGISPALNVGDVVIAEKALEAELSITLELAKNTPFADCLIQPLKNQPSPSQYYANPELLGLCDSLKKSNFKVLKGCVVSSDAFPAPTELFQVIKKFAPLCIDMESAAFYQTAWLLDAKALVVRGISNKLNSDGSYDTVSGTDIKGSSYAAAGVLMAILEKVITKQSRLGRARSAKPNNKR